MSGLPRAERRAGVLQNGDGSGRRHLLLQNLATFVSAGAAFLIFVGNGYYGELFEHFGLKQSILAISQVDMGTIGLYATIYSVPKVIWDNKLQIALGGIIGFAAVFTAYGLRQTTPGKVAIRLGAALSEFMERHSSWFLKWPTITFFGMTGLLAGHVGGQHDASYYDQEKYRAKRCFAVQGNLLRGVVLAQDQNRTIILHRDRVSLVKNDDVAFITDCPLRRPARPPQR